MVRVPVEGLGPALPRASWRWLALLVTGLLPLAAALPLPALAVPQVYGAWTHAYAEYGEIRYPAGFDHFDYANPDAPKGGTLRLSNPDRRTSYDKLNPFTLPLNAPAGVELFMFDTLAVQGQDEPATMYGLLAREIWVAPDLRSVSFRLDPRARFSNGDPVTAEDVKYSFDMLTSDQAAPTWSAQFDGVARAQVLDAGTIRFELKAPSRAQIYVLGTSLQVFSRKWGAGPDGKPRTFRDIVHEEPIASGPYRIARAETRTLDLVRRPDYWARDLGVCRGFYNFDHLVYLYYTDNAARFEALKAGDIDLVKEHRPARWVRQYVGPRFQDGSLVKSRIFDGAGHFYEGYIYNLRRPQLADRRVRQALNLSFDWAWTSRQAYDLDGRYEGLFENSDFAARGAPSPMERALLEPWRKVLPPAVFAAPAPNPDTSTPAALRANLRQARALLAEAGWTVGADGLARNARGEPLELELLDADGEFQPLQSRWAVNLRKLGIVLHLRVVDYAIYQKRMDAFDFDLTLINFGNFTLPVPASLRDTFGSKAARTEGSGNLAGLASPAIDALLDAIDRASTMDELVAAARALDRICIAEAWAMPFIFRPFNMVAHRKGLGMPAVVPRYYSVEDGDGAPPWPINNWWQATPN